MRNTHFLLNINTKVHIHICKHASHTLCSIHMQCNQSVNRSSQVHLSCKSRVCLYTEWTELFNDPPRTHPQRKYMKMALHGCFERWIILNKDAWSGSWGYESSLAWRSQAPPIRDIRVRSRAVHVYIAVCSWNTIRQKIRCSCLWMLAWLFSLSAWTSSLYACTSCYLCVHSLVMIYVMGTCVLSPKWDCVNRFRSSQHE